MPTINAICMEHFVSQNFWCTRTLQLGMTLHLLLQLLLLLLLLLLVLLLHL